MGRWRLVAESMVVMAAGVGRGCEGGSTGKRGSDNENPRIRVSG